ncbi:hypothetical protein BU26DRAFT_318317 [Trematosphaeria pertusa]|uniref:Uncharacterized protein n=1 Tax=Trematosphaeria pertusa TaxID=390896 RepID=A0A6A6IGV7_9PLEO|nr:uncharacterized protein BU26DRAFT_318317 [Trematosphaeria pertusa]KAF2249449.1 hypothetical protein BU26DRAFT_318317 [Trematosphaeria pertusa]
MTNSEPTLVCQGRLALVAGSRVEGYRRPRPRREVFTRGALVYRAHLWSAAGGTTYIMAGSYVVRRGWQSSVNKKNKREDVQSICGHLEAKILHRRGRFLIFKLHSVWLSLSLSLALLHGWLGCSVCLCVRSLLLSLFFLSLFCHGSNCIIIDRLCIVVVVLLASYSLPP